MNSDELAVRTLLEQWAAAVRAKDIDAVIAHHTDYFVMFDVPPPFRSVGLDAYRATWVPFYEWARDAGVFDIVDVTVVTGSDVAFAYASMRCAGFGDNGEREEIDFRLTVGFVRRDDQWLIAHEHHSVPAD